MTSFLSFRPHPLFLPSITDRSRAAAATSSNTLLLNRNNLPFSNHKPFTRSSVGVVRFGFLDSDGAADGIQHMFGRVEGLLYTIADAVVAASESTNAAKQNGDWFSGIANLMETVLKVLKDGISTVHAPYAYGFAIILLTVIVKAATFPLSKKQVESAMAMRNLQPQVKAIQQQYAGNKEKIQIETARLYKLAGVNPLAGCLPTLATIPIWIGLYRALSNVADEGLLTEGFFWIPTLSGPTTIASRQNGSGISWLFPFVDGHPPLGWSDTLAYLVLPVLLVVSQYVSLQITQSSQSNDPSMKSSQALTKFLPLMIGYFALSVPSGLSLYWFTNNILSTAQMIWLQKLGGANVTVRQFIDDTVVEEKPIFFNDTVMEEKQKNQKSVLEVKTTTATDSRQGEKLSSEGLRPGERFKMLKEQEARRKQQREEEKKKAEETVNQTAVTNEEHNEEVKLVITKDEVNEAELVDGGDERLQSVTNEEHNEEVKLVITKDEVNEAELVDGGDERLQSVTTEHNSSKVGVTSVNGGHSTLESKNNQEQVSLSSEDLKKEEVEIYTTTTAASAVVSENDAQQKNSTTEQKS